MYPRYLTTKVSDALADTRVVMVIGPRQAGKSTLVAEVAHDRRYITLDDPATLERARSNPSEFLDGYGTPLTIDEIQRAPELLLPIKLRVDRKKEAGSYLLTGSANVLTLPRVADSLAGRMEVIELLPLTQAEIEGDTTENAVDCFFRDSLRSGGSWQADVIEHRLVRGGFPEPAARSTPARRQAWFASYLRTLMDRDIRDLANIDGFAQLPRLLALIASRNGAPLNVASLSRDTGTPATTLNRYLHLLETLFLIQQVPAWSINAGKRLTKTAKTYLLDPSVVCNLVHWDEAMLRTDRTRLGMLIEGFVANELVRLITQSKTVPWLMHLRTVSQKEVDFVLEAPDGAIVGIEVKAAKNLRPEDWQGLEFLQELAGERFKRGIVLYGGNEAIPLSSTLLALPYAALWNTAPL